MVLSCQEILDDDRAAAVQLQIEWATPRGIRRAGAFRSAICDIHKTQAAGLTCQTTAPSSRQRRSSTSAAAAVTMVEASNGQADHDHSLLHHMWCSPMECGWTQLCTRVSYRSQTERARLTVPRYTAVANDDLLNVTMRI